MNEQEFLMELAKLKDRGWVLLGGTMLRTNANCDCPVTALAKVLKRLSSDATCDDAVKASARLGLSGPLAEDIIAAADGMKCGLRERMIEALEPEPA